MGVDMRRKGTGSKVFAWLLSFVMTLSLVPAVPQRAVAADDLAFREGHIKVSGEVTVAADKQLVQDLRWTFPFENPLRPGEGIADPGRPYKYVIWQSRKATNSDTWSD